MTIDGCRSRKHAEKISASVKKYFEENPSAREHLHNMYAGRQFGPTCGEGIALRYERWLESMIGGFWYGNVQYYVKPKSKYNSKYYKPNSKRYCEL